MLALRTLADSYPTPTRQIFPQEFIPTEVLTLVLHWDQGVWTLHAILTLRLPCPRTVGQLLLQLRLQFPQLPRCSRACAAHSYPESLWELSQGLIFHVMARPLACTT